jgi:hypothetical protein
MRHLLMRGRWDRRKERGKGTEDEWKRRDSGDNPAGSDHGLSLH